MRTILLSLLLYVVVQPVIAQPQKDPIPVLLRCDDIGMCHGVNAAAKRVADTGIPVSFSFMVPCPWFTEAVELFRDMPNVSIGIHLTLNSEWKNYRWGPSAGVTMVPSLVDSLGHFFPSRSRLYANNPRLEEIELELRTQINKALQAGLKVEYLDYHMGAAMQTPQTRAIVEKLAAEYGLAVSRYYGEQDVEGGYSAPVDNKLDTLLAKLKAVQPGGVKLLVFHLGEDSPEMAAMEDLNTFGLKNMSRHRQAETDALVSTAFQQLLREPRYRLVNYGMLVKERGLSGQQRPGQ
jgi:predicted glycoside hydrolase/deacetylase ChbG (UPF0249 family)